MAKTKISEWSSTPGSNTDIDGINIAENCPPSGINDAIREMMSQVKDLYSGTTGDAIAVAGGGTGATTASAARTALGVAIGTDVQAYDAKLSTLAGASANRATFLASDQGFGFRNRIINGDMRIDQRNNGASVTPATATYLLDRWVFNFTQASKFSFQQNAGSVTPPVGFTHYLGATVVSAVSVGAGDVFVLRQKIEGVNVSDLGWGTANAQTVTLSFWVRSSLTGTFGAAFQNSAENRAYPFTYSISAANTWEQKTITVAGDTTGTWVTNGGTGIQLSFSLGTGTTSSGTAGVWASANYASATGAVSVVGTNGATFYSTGVQLEAGSVASPFERRDYGREFDMCRRYYERFKNVGFYATGGAMYANQPRFCVTYYPKRTTPSFDFSAASTFIVQGNGTNQTPSGFSVAGQDINNTYFYPTGTTLAVGLSAALGNGTTSYLAFSAEL